MLECNWIPFIARYIEKDYYAWKTRFSKRNMINNWVFKYELYKQVQPGWLARDHTGHRWKQNIYQRQFQLDYSFSSLRTNWKLGLLAFFPQIHKQREESLKFFWISHNNVVSMLHLKIARQLQLACSWQALYSSIQINHNFHGRKR